MNIIYVEKTNAGLYISLCCIDYCRDSANLLGLGAPSIVGASSSFTIVAMGLVSIR